MSPLTIGAEKDLLVEEATCFFGDERIPVARGCGCWLDGWSAPQTQKRASISRRASWLFGTFAMCDDG
jgi:hypothetical protein